jgi:pantothenate kinase
MITQFPSVTPGVWFCAPRKEIIVIEGIYLFLEGEECGFMIPPYVSDKFLKDNYFYYIGEL